MIGNSPERISSLRETQKQNIRIECVFIENFFSGGYRIEGEELKKFDQLIRKLEESMKEEFGIIYCSKGKLPENRIDITLRAEYGNVCYTSSLNDRFWCDVFIQSFGIVPFWGAIQAISVIKLYKLEK